MKDYREIEIYAGENIDSTIKKLSEFKERGELACATFNDKVLYSDVDDLDSAYKKITGKTKEEFNAERAREHDEWEERKRKHEEAIPELTKEWIEKGNAILDKKYHDYWAKIVPVRLGDLYRGMELGYCLDIVKPLNDGEKFEDVKEILISQGHSGMSFGLICSMIRAFCNIGNEFVEYVK